MHKLNIDEAVAEFRAMLRAELGPEPAVRSRAEAPATPEEIEAWYFRRAHALLRLACPDPTQCTDQRCRRGRQCRHFADLSARQQAQQDRRPTRRTPGADALRHAIWVYMNSGGTARTPSSDNR